MTNRQKSHFGGDGYKELFVKGELKQRDDRPLQDGKLNKLKDKEYKNKKMKSRAGKYLHPKGTGKRNIGQFR